MTKKILSISVSNYPGKDAKSFDYLAPDDKNLPIGALVLVPFRNQKRIGVVMGQSKTAAVDKSILPIERMLELPPLPDHCTKLAQWLMSYYAASPGAVWRTVLPGGLEKSSRLKPLVAVEKPEPPMVTLSTEQQTAVDDIWEDPQAGTLLHGITGSGKTEVYTELIKRTLASGKSCFMLLPEIALTPQMVERLSVHFADQLVVSHSRLSPARRKQIWTQALTDNTPKVYLGPRSILFMPVSSLGLIVVDEEHETSYKQDNSPTYLASTVAAKLAELTAAKFVFGSATPSLYTRRAAELGRINYIHLPNRALGASLPPVQVVKLSRGTILSPELTNEIKKTLNKGKQTMLFLNRRGSANAMVCEDCGHIELCPRCDTSLTFHADIARLICHHCSYSKLPPTSCSQCSQTHLYFVGSGTKRIETEIHKLFPQANIYRLDSDNNTLEAIDEAYQRLKDGSIDIIIGTQMIARGLDLENITTVGVILAESMLAIPDFSSNERTFDLLTQVAGRAGRGRHTGKVIIQTYSPNHPAIISASQHSYDAFYTFETKGRKKHAYPPYAYLLKLVYSHRNEAKAIAEAVRFRDELKRIYPKLVILGPSERSIKRVAGRHQRQLIIKSLTRPTLVNIAKAAKAGWKHDLDPINLM